MNSLPELQVFAQALAPFCAANQIKFSCLQVEQDLLHTPNFSCCPRLFLTLLTEELACGHIVPTVEGRDLFIRVRTPFAASASLKFVTLRTHSLVLIEQRGLAIDRFERRLPPVPPRPDIWELLTQATASVLQTSLEGSLFLQPEQIAPFPLKNQELQAFRSTFCSGVLAGTVHPSALKGVDLGGSPVELYLL